MDDCISCIPDRSVLSSKSSNIIEEERIDGEYSPFECMDCRRDMFDRGLETPRRRNQIQRGEQEKNKHTASSQFCRLYVLERSDIDMMAKEYVGDLCVATVEE
jgi:hypothetical protein